MSELTQPIRIADPNDKEYQKFIRYFSQGGGKIDRASVGNSTIRQKLIEAVIAATDRDHVVEAFTFLAIVNGIAESVREGDAAVYKTSEFIDEEARNIENEEIAKLEKAGLLFHDKKSGKSFLTEGAVAVLLGVICNFDKENKVKTPPDFRNIKFISPEELERPSDIMDKGKRQIEGREP